MSQGTPISNLKKSNNLVNDIMKDYNAKQGITPDFNAGQGGMPPGGMQEPTSSQHLVQPQQYDPTPPGPISQQEEQQQPQKAVEEEYYDYDPATYDEQEPYVPTILDELKPVIVFFLLFVVLNYIPIVSLLDLLLVNINVPYLSLIIRAIIGAILFFFIKKFI